MQVTGNNIPSAYKSIRLCMDGLSFFQAGSWESIPFTTGDTLLEQALAQCLCHPFFSNESEMGSHIEVSNPYTTVIPHQLLNNQDALTVFRFLFPEAKQEDFVVFSQSIDTFNITLLFAVPTAQYQLMQQLSPACQWKHRAAQNIENNLKISKQQGSTRVLLQQQGDYTHICVASNGALQFANHFYTPTPQDTLFYCAQVYEQCNLSQQSTPLYADAHADRLQLLQQHLVHCYPIKDYANC